MNRLQSELQRLYLPRPSVHEEGAAFPTVLIDASGAVRALVVELARPASWEVLAKVWRGVQTDLELPAPAIAVSGTDALQLWFSLAEPVCAARAHAFLEGLRLRFLPDIAAHRIRLLPASDASALHQQEVARLVPALQVPGENWSAFVAPDLAPVFAETPWLDVPPSEDGQAALLHGLQATKPAAFEAALQRLGASAQFARTTAPKAPQAAPARTDDLPATADADADPRRFLLRVMNDDTVALALRIEAARALLPHAAR